MPEVTEVGEVQALDPSEQIVALFCTSKPNQGLSDAEKLGLSLHIIKAGEKPLKLRAGQYAKMKRATADWHVGQSRAWDPGNKLMLEIVTEEEARKRTSKGTLVASDKTREELVAEAIAKGIVKDEEEAKTIDTATLKEALAL